MMVKVELQKNWQAYRQTKHIELQKEQLLKENLLSAIMQGSNFKLGLKYN